MLEDLNNTKNTERNNIQAVLIKSALTDFKNRINSMSENETRFEQPNETVNIVEKTLEFNGKQSGQGLKILTSNQMLKRLSISLAQLNAGNNFKNLKAKFFFFILSTDQKNLQNKSIKVWLTLFKAWKLFL